MARAKARKAVAVAKPPWGSAVADPPAVLPTALTSTAKRAAIAAGAATTETQP